jgi:hypothetical protein
MTKIRVKEKPSIKEKQKEKPTKTCFLITPIGSTDSFDRNRVNQWQKLIYEPAIGEEYLLIRSDKIAAPGTITKQIIDSIIDSDLVIIDFTPPDGQPESNANVMYEAAIRHIAQKPLIQIAPSSLRIPFDIKDFRYIDYDPRDLSYPQTLQERIKLAVKEIHAPGYEAPDLIGQKFDLNRIVSDPEKFIEILKDKLFPYLEKKQRFEESGSFVRSISASMGGATVSATSSSWILTTCPFCGSYLSQGGGGGTSTWSHTSGTHSHNTPTHTTSSSRVGVIEYHCSNCGTTFWR